MDDTDLAEAGTFAERVVILAKTYGGTSALSRVIGVSEGAVRKWINGAEPTRDKLVALAVTAGVSLEWLATGRGPMYPGGVEQATATSSCEASLEPTPQENLDLVVAQYRVAQARVKELEAETERLKEISLALKLKEDTRLLGELGINGIATIASRGTVANMWHIAAFLGERYPKRASLDEIFKYLSRQLEPVTGDEVQADLAALKHQGLVVHSAEGFTLGTVNAEVRARDVVNVNQHLREAVRALVQEVLPAVERGDKTGYLMTAGISVPAEDRAGWVRKLFESVRDLRDATGEDSGTSEIRLVFGVALADNRAV